MKFLRALRLDRRAEQVELGEKVAQLFICLSTERLCRPAWIHFHIETAQPHGFAVNSPISRFARNDNTQKQNWN
jgi:hypothetical protein